MPGSRLFEAPGGCAAEIARAKGSLSRLPLMCVRRSDRMRNSIMPNRGRLASLLLLMSLASAGLSANELDSRLSELARAGDRAAVSRLLQQDGVDVDATQVDGTAALHWAAYGDDAELASMLLDAGADPDAVNRNGFHPARARLRQRQYRRRRAPAGRGCGPATGADRGASHPDLRANRARRRGSCAACPRSRPRRGGRLAGPDAADVGRRGEPRPGHEPAARGGRGRRHVFDRRIHGADVRRAAGRPRRAAPSGRGRRRGERADARPPLRRPLDASPPREVC